MQQSIFQILNTFLTGKVTAHDAGSALLSHFRHPPSEKRRAITRQYIDEIMADLEAGLVTIESASEGLEESAAASHL